MNIQTSEKAPPLAKVLVIGLDSGDKDLVEAWTRDGSLPNLKALRGSALVGETQNPLHLEAGSAWPTFHSGHRPGSHALYDALRYFEPSEGKYTWHSPGPRVAEPFWKKLSDEGLRCAVIDAPYTFLEKDFNGLNIVDCSGHVPSQGGSVMQLAATPASTVDEVLRVGGEDPTHGIMCDDKCPETTAELGQFRDTYVKRIARKGKITKHFLEKGNWDYFQVVFSDCHCMGHHLWHVNDPNHPRYDPSVEHQLGEPLKDGYRALDAAIGEILELIDERTLVLIYGSHGIGPQISATGLLEHILASLDSGIPFSPPKGWRHRAKSIWSDLPPIVRSQMRPLKNQLGKLVATGSEPSPVEGRRFFEVLVNNATGGVRINLAGREPNGIVAPEDYGSVVEELVGKISEIKVAGTDQRLASEVIVTSRLHSGERASDLPDILVVWNRDVEIGAVVSPLIGTIPNRFGADRRSGDHRPSGFFYAVGGGTSSAILNASVDAIDFAPTIVKAFGIDPSHFPGAVIPGVQADIESNNPVVLADAR